MKIKEERTLNYVIVFIQKKGFNSFRKGWYYQQVLKLIYWTIIQNYIISLNKIRFFKKRNEPIKADLFLFMQ